jgi:RecA/RadA recombinase
MNEEKLKKMIVAANKCLDMTWMTGTAMWEKRKNITKINTGCEELNELLGGKELVGLFNIQYFILNSDSSD